MHTEYDRCKHDYCVDNHNRLEFPRHSAGVCLLPANTVNFLGSSEFLRGFGLTYSHGGPEALVYSTLHSLPIANDSMECFYISQATITLPKKLCYRTEVRL